MNLSKIHHIAIIVSDYEVAKNFYVNKLGFSVIRENYRPERKTTVAGRAAKEKEKELEKWLRGLDGMERLVEDYGGQIPLWEKIMDRQGSVCCVWEKTAFEEGLKVGIRLMTEVYGA